VTAGSVDGTRTGLERFRTYEVRFQVLNDSDSSVEIVPTLSVGAGDPAVAVQPVTATGPTPGEPFYLGAEAGRVEAPDVLSIAVADLRLAQSPDPVAVGVPGLRSRGIAPTGRLVLPAHSFTEVAVAVRATAAARWLETYTFRLGDAPVVSRVDAVAVLRAKPAIGLSPGQRPGDVESDPVPLYRLKGPTAMTAAAITGADEPLTPAGLFGATAPADPHLDFSLTGDSCAGCHAGHTAQGPFLQAEASPGSTLCFRCHDGSGALADVKSQYDDPLLPDNDPATASIYAHPATALSDHTTDRDDEFGGKLDRHAACADCHQPHVADTTPPEQSSQGWTASGAIRGASGVAVVNGPAGSSPAYTWQPRSDLEYELCFKCHSGFTQLPSGDPDHPSGWSLDKGVELNPANLSYHPIEAAGTNATEAMTASLAGTSPYKLWTFQADSTIRCVNCHGDPSKATPASPPDAATALAPHASEQRGLLMAAYRDRELKPNGEAYAAADFALCFQCHGESPMVDISGDPNAQTNFRYHGVHLQLAAGEGIGGQDIDQDGAGQGNLVCAECHFRIHGTTFAVDGQPATSRLVNFAPDARPVEGVLRWTPSATGGTCTLVCHGVTHRGWGY
jgi:predicted CXXCH cytochrome family protein